MPIGDLVSKGLSGQQLSPAEISQVRFILNSQQQQASRSSGLLDPVTGGLDANAFIMQSNFSLLPHECAKVTLTTSPQTIANNTLTEMSWSLDGGQDFNYGMNVSSSGIRVQEMKKSVLLIQIFIIWDDDTTGYRTANVYSEEGLHYVETQDATQAAGIYTYQNISYIRQVTSGTNENNYSIKVRQTSGGDLDVMPGSYFAVCRLR